MNYEKIKTSINNPHVNGYISYLKKVEKEKKLSDNGSYVDKNTWFKYFTEEQAIELFNNVLNLGLYVDGDSVTIQFLGGNVVPNFNYHAYKNLVLIKYPETIFDFQNVYEGDEFSFRKENGKVIYKHVFGNPFNNNRKLIGAYGIIKNKRGEFIETLNIDEIKKLKSIAKTKAIWDAWEAQMVNKSIIKRICKVNFKDIVEPLENTDNENYDFELADFDDRVYRDIQEAQTLSDIVAIFRREKGVVNNQNKLIELCAERKKEIEVKPGTIYWDNALSDLKAGMTTSHLVEKYYINEDNLSRLINEAV